MQFTSRVSYLGFIPSTREKIGGGEPIMVMITLGGPGRKLVFDYLGLHSETDK